MIVCLDLETTGLNPKTDHIIEVAIVRFNGRAIVDKWTILIKPPVPIPAFTTHLTGITNAMVAEAPSLAECLPEIKNHLGEWPIMGHFIQFDTNFLREKGLSIPNLELDTCQLAQAVLEKETSYSLEVLAKSLKIPQPSAHRALDDVLANIELYHRLKDHIAAFDTEAKTALQNILAKSSWNWRELVLEALEQKEGHFIESSSKIGSPAIVHRIDLDSICPKDSIFLMEESTHTRADLLSHAMHQQEPVLLSLPQVDDLEENPELGVLKHPSQYLSLPRLNQFLSRTNLTAIETMFACKVKRWSLSTQTGEKREIRLAREEINLWNEVCGEESPIDSFYEAAQKRAAEKKILAVSHHYFLKDRARKDPLIPQRPSTVIGSVEALLETLEDAWHIKINEAKLVAGLKREADRKRNPEEDSLFEQSELKVSMIFGLLSIFYKKNTAAEDWHCQLQTWHWTSLEWSSLKKGAEGLEDHLEKILSNDASRENQEVFKELSFFIRTLKTATPNTWLSTNKEEHITLHYFPTQTTEIFKSRVWAGLEKIHLFGHQLTLNDAGHFVKNELGLNNEVPCLQNNTTQVLPLDTPKNSIASPNDPKNISDCVHELSEYLLNVEGDIFILVNSALAMEHFFHKFNDWIKTNGRKAFVQNMSGGLGKMTKMAQSTLGKNVFIGNEDLLDILIREQIALKRFVLHKLPFKNPTDPVQIARAAHYKNAYQEFSLPCSSLHFRRLIDTFLGDDWTDKRLLILDPRLKEHESLFL